MNVQEHTKPENLLRYSFWWNEARLVIAAVSLLWGTTPVLYRLLNTSAGGFITIASVISGLAALYLLVEWNKHGRKVFGDTNNVDLAAFLIATLSGVHLGLGGLLNTNIIMSTLGYSGFLFTIAVYAGGLLYLWSAYHLHKRYKENGERLFDANHLAPPTLEPTEEPKPETEKPV